MSNTNDKKQPDLTPIQKVITAKAEKQFHEEVNEYIAAVKATKLYQRYEVNKWHIHLPQLFDDKGEKKGDLFNIATLHPDERNYIAGRAILKNHMLTFYENEQAENLVTKFNELYE